MSVTTLDPRTALIVIDLQKGLAAFPAVEPVQAIAEKAGALASEFRRHGLPVVLVNVAGVAPGRTEQGHRAMQFPPDWTKLMPELGQQPQDRHRGDALARARLADDAERLVLVDVEAQVVDRVDHAVVGVEVHPQVAHLQQRPVPGVGGRVRFELDGSGSVFGR